MIKAGLALLPVGAIFLGVALAWALGAAGILLYPATGYETYLQALPRRIFSQMDVFALMAMPLFILVGELMNRLKVTDVLIRFSMLLVGKSKGGLGHVNIATSLFFANVSGSAMADAAALSTTLVPSMREKGYSAEYAGAITAASSMIGPIIPPSIILIFYGAIMGVDVATLFAAAVVPGLLLALTLFLANAVFARMGNHPREDGRPPFLETVLRALPALLMPVIVIAGIVFGLVTPTEAGALAVIAVLAASLLLRTLTVAAVKESFIQAAKMTGVIFSLLVSAAALNFLAALSGLPELVGGWASGLNLSLPGFVVLMLAVFLVCGMFLDTQVALVLVAPILAPAAYALGGDPVHLGIVICLTISLGLITPPIGGAILVVTSVTGTPYGRLMRATLPFVVIEFLLILLFALCPDIVLALPRLIGA